MCKSTIDPPESSAEQRQEERPTSEAEDSASGSKIPNSAHAALGSLSEEYIDVGVWPPWWWKLKNDLFVWRRSDRTDGLKSPLPKPPYFLDERGSDSELVLDIAREHRQYIESGLDLANARAARLLRTALGLLVVAFGSASFLLSRLIDDGWNSGIVFLLLIPSLVALVSLIFAALQALGADRVGLGMAPRIGPIAEASDQNRFRVAIDEEVRSAQVTRWTAENKLYETNLARRSLSWGIVALGCSVIVIIIFALPIGKSESQPPPAQDEQENSIRTTSVVD